LSENIECKRKINEVVVDIDSKEEMIQTLYKDNEDKQTKILGLEITITDTEKINREQDTSIQDLKNEMKIKDENIKEIYDNIEVKRKKIDDIKSQHKTENKKMKESYKLQSENEIKKFSDEIK